MQSADAARSDRDQGRAEWRFMHAIADGKPGTAGLIFSRRQGFQSHEEIMQPSRAGQPDRAGKVEHAARRGQARLGVLNGEVLDEALGTDARPAREQALEMMLAEVKMPGHG